MYAVQEICESGISRCDIFERNAYQHCLPNEVKSKQQTPCLLLAPTFRKALWCFLNYSRQFWIFKLVLQVIYHEL
jgi:hypothetical protein